MKKAAIVYSYHSSKSAKIAEKMVDLLQKYSVVQLNVEECTGADLLEYTCLILSVPTWFDGELPNYWDEILPALDKLNFGGSTVALYGLGDQKGYPENFCDAVGLLADFFSGRGAKIVGYTSAEGYSFEASKALKGNKFCGLMIDQENQAKLTEERISQWIKQLEIEMFQ